MRSALEDPSQVGPGRVEVGLIGRVAVKARVGPASVSDGAKYLAASSVAAGQRVSKFRGQRTPIAKSTLR